MRKILLPLCAALMLSGCASKILESNEPAPYIYSLRASENIAPLQTKGTSKVLEVQRPSLPPGFDTARMAMYLEQGRRLDYYAGAKWAAPLDEMVQEFTNQTARRALPNMIVAAPGQSIDVDYRLQMKINDLQPVYAAGPDQAPVLTGSVTFTLLALPNEKIITSFTVDQNLNAPSNNLGAITAGLQDILQSIEGKAFETLSARIAK